MHSAQECLSPHVASPLWTTQNKMQLLMDFFNQKTNYHKICTEHQIPCPQIKKWVSELTDNQLISPKYDFLIWKDKDLRFMDFNQNMHALGTKTKVVDAKGLTDFDVCPEFANDYLPAQSEVLETHETQTGNVETVVDNIGPLQGHCTMYPIYNERGDSDGLFIVGRFDIHIDSTPFPLIYNLINQGYAHYLIKANRYRFLYQDDYLEFSPRQMELFLYLSIGKSAKEIARFIGLSPRSVEVYIANMKKILGCFTTYSLVNFFLEQKAYSYL